MPFMLTRIDSMCLYICVVAPKHSKTKDGRSPADVRRQDREDAQPPPKNSANKTEQDQNRNRNNAQESGQQESSFNPTRSQASQESERAEATNNKLVCNTHRRPLNKIASHQHRQVLDKTQTISLFVLHAPRSNSECLHDKECLYDK